MKHLKTFESNNRLSEEEMILDIKDICLELQDEGFTINTGNSSYNRSPYIYLCIYKSDGDRTYSKKFIFTHEISEIIERIKDYVSDKGLEIEIHYEGVGVGGYRLGYTVGRIGESYYEITLYFRYKNKDPKTNEEINWSKLFPKKDKVLPKDFLKDVSDIFLELKDEGFTIDGGYLSDNGSHTYWIFKKRIFSIDFTQMLNFNINETSETILRLYDYSSSSGISMKVLGNEEHKYLRNYGSRTNEIRGYRLVNVSKKQITKEKVVNHVKIIFTKK